MAGSNNPQIPSRKSGTIIRLSLPRPGGADIWAYDVNGDGLNDVITSVDAHAWGLVWWEQVRENQAGDGTADNSANKAGANISFKQHTIMGSRPSENPYGVFVSEPHSVVLADVDGDGLKDILTGKTYWSHHRQKSELGRRADGVLVQT